MKQFLKVATLALTLISTGATAWQALGWGQAEKKPAAEAPAQAPGHQAGRSGACAPACPPVEAPACSGKSWGQKAQPASPSQGCR